MRLWPPSIFVCIDPETSMRTSIRASFLRFVQAVSALTVVACDAGAIIGSKAGRTLPPAGASLPPLRKPCSLR